MRRISEPAKMSTVATMEKSSIAVMTEPSKYAEMSVVQPLA
jgi:hypothetical protein